MNNFDCYEIYKATMPDNYTDEFIENQINVFDRIPFFCTKIVEMYNTRPIKKDWVTITGVNGEYCLHPGTTKYIFASVVKQPITAYIVNRYNTNYETIKKTFPDAELYTQNIHSLLISKYSEDRKGHFNLFFGSEEKDEWDINFLSTKYENLSGGKENLLINNTILLSRDKDKPTRNIEVDTLKELAIEVLKNYTDFEEKYDTD